MVVTKSHQQPASKNTTTSSTTTSQPLRKMQTVGKSDETPDQDAETKNAESKGDDMFGSDGGNKSVSDKNTAKNSNDDSTTFLKWIVIGTVSIVLILMIGYCKRCN